MRSPMLPLSFPKSWEEILSDLRLLSYLKKVPPSLDIEDDRVVHDADHGDREALQEHDGKGEKVDIESSSKLG